MTEIQHNLDRTPTVRSDSKLTTAILRSEALAALLAGIGLWFMHDGSLVWLFPALLLPDVSMVGYAAGSRLGAIAYNFVHNWTLALALLAIGWWSGIESLLLGGALVLAHVGMDRMLGYGLKLPTDFRDTHLGRIGGGSGPRTRAPVS